MKHLPSGLIPGVVCRIKGKWQGNPGSFSLGSSIRFDASLISIIKLRECSQLILVNGVFLEKIWKENWATIGGKAAWSLYLESHTWLHKGLAYSFSEEAPLESLNRRSRFKDSRGNIGALPRPQTT